MWAIRSEQLDVGQGQRYAVELDARSATFAEVIRGWREDAAFRSMFNDSLARSPFAAFRWETPSVTGATAPRPFEFVLLDSPGLAKFPDPEAFAEHFLDAADATVVVSPKLGGDAILVVPLPITAASSYGHIAAFVRCAPDVQCQALWRSVGEAMTRRIGVKPVWLSTAGAGVSWLHVRLDDRPKYYGFAPYKQAASW